jgi:hypothetical protein
MVTPKSLANLTAARRKTNRWGRGITGGLGYSLKMALPSPASIFPLPYPHAYLSLPSSHLRQSAKLTKEALGHRPFLSVTPFPHF